MLKSSSPEQKIKLLGTFNNNYTKCHCISDLWVCSLCWIFLADQANETAQAQIQMSTAHTDNLACAFQWGVKKQANYTIKRHKNMLADSSCARRSECPLYPKTYEETRSLFTVYQFRLYPGLINAVIFVSSCSLCCHAAGIWAAISYFLPPAANLILVRVPCLQ